MWCFRFCCDFTTGSSRCSRQFTFTCCFVYCFLKNVGLNSLTGTYGSFSYITFSSSLKNISSAYTSARSGVWHIHCSMGSVISALGAGGPCAGLGDVSSLSTDFLWPWGDRSIFHINSTSLRIIHISLPVFCLSLFRLLWDQGCHISPAHPTDSWCCASLTATQRSLTLVPGCATLNPLSWFSRKFCSALMGETFLALCECTKQRLGRDMSTL